MNAYTVRGSPCVRMERVLRKNISQDNIMKIRLPKSLLAALVATFAVCSASLHAETITGEYVTDGFVKVTDSLNIGDGIKDTSYTVTGETSGEEETFVVAGTNAVVTVNKATINGIPEHSQLGIGDGADGKMVVENGSRVDLSTGGTVYMGYKSTGELTVKGESTFIGTYNNLWMYGNSTINVEDNSSVKMCATSESGYNYRALLAVSGGGKAEINVSGGSQFTCAASQFVTNFASDTTVNINASGKGSVFTQAAETESEGYYPIGTSGEWVKKTPGEDIPSKRVQGYYDRDSSAASWESAGHGQTITYLCDSGTDQYGCKAAPQWGCTTNISATEGGKVDFQSTITYIGSFLDKEKGYTDKTANLTVGSGSEMSFKRMEIYADTNITNGGTFNATEVTVHDGAVLSYTATGEADIEVDSLTVKDGAELSLIFGEAPEEVVTFALSRTGESSASMLLDTMLTLESGSVLNIEGGILDLGGKALTIADGAIINAVGLDEDAGIQTLFTNVGQLTMEEGTSVTFNGTTTQLSYNGNSVVVGAVPEPTAATLSLLALAGLAGRRRRK